MDSLIQSENNKFAYVHTIIHELQHILGFDETVFRSKGLLEEIDVEGRHTTADGWNTHYGFTGEKTVKYAREYFGCNSLEAVPFEDDAKGGSA